MQEKDALALRQDTPSLLVFQLDFPVHLPKELLPGLHRAVSNLPEQPVHRVDTQVLSLRSERLTDELHTGLLRGPVLLFGVTRDTR